MNKIFIAMILLTTSTLLNATKEVKAKIVYDTDNKRLLSVMTDSKNEYERQKCEEYLRSDDGINILKIISKNNRGRVLVYFICNQEITESKRK
ncbi:hypothetical protein ACG9ZL_20940 [Acinetobacter sp. ULE_I057]|uniref:hypothetical protein n=1 Tax=Acinetobacter sp. ULE_I057 TaxID=3373070 RepID=UPI003AF44DB5